jgi:hypothetical protein
MKTILTSLVVSLPFLMLDLSWMRRMTLSVVLVVGGATSAGNFLTCSKTKSAPGKVPQQEEEQQH